VATAADDPISKAMLALLEELDHSPLDTEAAGRLSDVGIGRHLDAWHRLRAAADGAIVQLQGEANRRQVFRHHGAASPTEWQAARFGLAKASARIYNRIGDKAIDLPEMTHALSAGRISLDKMRILVPVATSKTDRKFTAEARNCTVHELQQMLRARRRPQPPPGKPVEEVRSLRFNDNVRTMTVQLPPAEYVETKACIEAQAKAIPTDRETKWDQRCCDAFLGILRFAGHIRGSSKGPQNRSGSAGKGGQSAGSGGGTASSRRERTNAGRETSGATSESSPFDDATSRVDGSSLPPSPFFAVLHAPLSAFFGNSGAPSDLAGDLEHGDLIDLDTVRRLVCDSTFVIAVDDDTGHTMYEGRQRRSPTGAQRREIWRRDRCCRYPGCENALFVEPHHLEWWSKGGRTDVPNLALLCKRHHRLMHSKGWSVTGNANELLTFTGPDGRERISRPSPMWTAISNPDAPPPRSRTEPRATT
jgi:hypothetical protein